MVIKLRRDGFVATMSMNIHERKAFLIFLKLEKIRHMDDINAIDNTIARLNLILFFCKK